jgi:O-antigen/teichoic acid export membrane protein
MRYLNVLDYGRYTFAFALVALVGTFGEWGFGLFTTREAARDRSRATTLVPNLAAVYVLVGLVVLATTTLINAAFHRPLTIRLATMLVAVYWTSASVSELLNGVLRAWERMDVEGMLGMAERTLAVGIGCFGIWRRWQLLPLVGATMVAGLFRCALAAALVHRRFCPVTMRLTPAAWVGLIRQSIPLSLTGILMLSYYRVDMVLIPLMSGERALGLYAAARKLLDALSFLPAAFMNAILPRLTQHFASDRERFRASSERVLKSVALVTFPLAGALFAFANPLVHMLAGKEFAASAGALRVLAWSFVFMGTNWVLWAILTAADQQHRAIPCTAAALAANVLLNLCLIPSLSYHGAALALLLTEGVACLFLARAAGDICDSRALPALWWRPALAAGVLVAGAGGLAGYPSAVRAGVAVAGCLAVLFLTRALSRDDW